VNPMSSFFGKATHLINAANKTTLVITFVVVIVLFLLFGGGAMIAEFALANQVYAVELDNALASV
jgi:hypothetical protein